jgi:hypothetical protein
MAMRLVGEASRMAARGLPWRETGEAGKWVRDTKRKEGERCQCFRAASAQLRNVT